MKPAKPTVAECRRLTMNKRLGSWLAFKHRLMDRLEIPADQRGTWDVPQEWITAYKKMCGR
jgi:hypothetical protein